MHRRQLLAAGAACTSTVLLAGAGSGASARSTGPVPASRQGGETSLVGDYLDLTTPRGNRQAQARIMGNIDMESTKYGWFKGVVHGVRPGEKVRDLIGFSGFSATRLLPHDDPEAPGYKKLLREVGFYTDLETGEVLESWHNPYLDETVRVVPIANDPFNHTITDYMIAPPNYGGLNNDMPVRVPLQLDWNRMGDLLMLSARINLFYPAALQPDEWPRESSGKFNRVSEMFLYQMSWDEMQNPEITGLELAGSWIRITPWLPWMLMGPSEGHCTYTCFFGSTNSLDGIDPIVLDYAAKHYPKYLEAPKEWVEPSLSSLEWYAREQKPAPLPADGTVPTAPKPPSI